jgi:hypothetical protein
MFDSSFSESTMGFLISGMPQVRLRLGIYRPGPRHHRNCLQITTPHLRDTLE